jgi:ABC-type nitrate/sulfonate/bicarbonate transport system substrate-binding protein
MIRAFIGDNPEIVRRYVGSQFGAIAVMKTDREMAIKALAKYPGQIKDHDVLVKSYDATAPADRISCPTSTV